MDAGTLTVVIVGIVYLVCRQARDLDLDGGLGVGAAVILASGVGAVAGWISHGWVIDRSSLCS